MNPSEIVLHVVKGDCCLSTQPPWILNTDAFVAVSGDLIACVELSGVQPAGFQINTEGTQLPDQVAKIEKQLRIYDLIQFTPKS